MKTLNIPINKCEFNFFNFFNKDRNFSDYSIPRLKNLWNYSKMIIDKLKGNNYKYIIAFPEIIILDDTKLLTNKLFI